MPAFNTAREKIRMRITETNPLQPAAAPTGGPPVVRLFAGVGQTLDGCLRPRRDLLEQHL
ncbi:MAG: hypothetical protein JW749_03595 [Sedimentisphaerales bacterium]|nr:hypothetical protein [Sedimentisphaerales bacterium]